MISRKKQIVGFTLIEVLVAVLILSIGFLGMAALQITALKSNQSAIQRSQATILAYSMMDEMRANKAVAAVGQYDLAKTCVTPVADGTLRTNGQVAWFNALKINLGNQSATCGEITCSTAICLVKVYWDDSRAVSGTNTQFVEIKSVL